jgi:glycosyltransferase involved in cell wall biosynthesis
VIANGNVNGIDVAFFNALNLSEQENNALREKLNIAPTDFVFIFVGRLVGDKGINELIAAFAQLTNYNTKLLLVGSFETELDPLQKNTLVQIDTNANIISVGYQNDVRPFFAISNALAFPSYREGFPNVVLQAGAMGLPSVVTNINGSNEIIIDGQNGVIVPVKNNTELHDAMLKMRSDSDFYSQLQRNARAMIASRYEQQVVWEAILSEYKRLEQDV